MGNSVTPGAVSIEVASPQDLEAAVACLASAFAQDPITGFLLQAGPGYRERVSRFFSILMRVRMTLGMPVFVAREGARIRGACMGYSTIRPEWPAELSEEWEQFERVIPGLPERMAIYDEVAERFQPSAPHYYLGVIGTDPAAQGLGIGSGLMAAFRDASARDPLSSGVYLETAQPSNLRFYANAGFIQTGSGALGDGTLWCLFHPQERSA